MQNALIHNCCFWVLLISLFGGRVQAQGSDQFFQWTRNLPNIQNSGGSIVGMINAPGTPLPILFSFVSAFRKESGVMVQWGTGGENNVLGFEILRSTDGKEFLNIAIVRPKGIASNYSYFDADHPGPLYYRISVISSEGIPQFSNTVVVPGRQMANTELLPNILYNNSFRIIPSSYDFSVGVYRPDGALVQWSTHLLTSLSPIDIIFDQPAGNYLVLVTDKGGRGVLLHKLLTKH